MKNFGLSLHLHVYIVHFNNVRLLYIRACRHSQGISQLLGHLHNFLNFIFALQLNVLTGPNASFSHSHFSLYMESRNDHYFAYHWASILVIIHFSLYLLFSMAICYHFEDINKQNNIYTAKSCSSSFRGKKT